MKTAREVAEEFDDASLALQAQRVFRNLILTDRRAVVDALESWLSHDERRDGKRCHPGKCICGLDAAIQQILENKGENDA